MTVQCSIYSWMMFARSDSSRREKVAAFRQSQYFKCFAPVEWASWLPAGLVWLLLASVVLKQHGWLERLLAVDVGTSD